MNVWRNQSMLFYYAKMAIFSLLQNHIAFQEVCFCVCVYSTVHFYWNDDTTRSPDKRVKRAGEQESARGSQKLPFILLCLYKLHVVAAVVVPAHMEQYDELSRWNNDELWAIEFENVHTNPPPLVTSLSSSRVHSSHGVIFYTFIILNPVVE